MTIDAVALSNSGKIRPDGCIIDGEAVACDDNGVASFDRIRYRRHDGDVFLHAFDLIELSGDDLRRWANGGCDMGDTSSDFILEILSREVKYIYYLLAATGACIGFDFGIVSTQLERVWWWSLPSQPRPM